MASKGSIHFLVPPQNLRIGGLEAAIQGLALALEQNGWEVRCEEEQEPVGEDIDLLHIHGLWRTRSSAAARAVKNRDIPYIVSPHGMLEPWARQSKQLKKSIYFHLLERRLLLNAQRILTTSKQESENLAIYCPSLKALCQDIPLGIDPPPPVETREDCRRQLGLAEGERILLYLSRIDRKKGLDLLIRALAETPEHTFDRLLIVGDGDPKYKSELEMLCHANRDQLPEIQWAGAVWGEDKWRYLRAANLFCLPTHSENFGFAVLEAILVATPVLTTDQTPWSDWGQGIEGIQICRPDAASITSALLNTKTDGRDNSGDSLAAWGRDNFLWEKLVPRYDAMYREVISKPPD